MRSVDFINVTGTAKALAGGLYQFAAVATWGGGNVKVQELGPDDTTWLDVGTALSSNGLNTVSLPPGTYRLTVTTATGVSASLVRVPGE